MGLRGLGNRRIHLRRLYWGLEEGRMWGVVRDVQEFQVSCFQLIDAFLQLEIFLR